MSRTEPKPNAEAVSSPNNERAELLISIKNPELGKGWYRSGVMDGDKYDDQAALAWIRNIHPNATGVRITREYRIGHDRKGRAVAE